MGFIASTATRLIGGDLSLSAYTVDVSPTWTATMLDVTCLPDLAKVFIVGQDTSTFHVGGILDVVGTATTSSFDHIANTWKTTADVPFTIAPRGYTFGNELFGVVANESAFSVGSAVADKAVFSLDAQTDGTTDFGVSLHDLTAETTSTNSTFNDGGAATAGGAAGFLHVTAFSGLTNIIVKIQHSTASGSGYADLITFSTVTGLTSQRSTVTGTVNQYSRALWTVTGSGSCTFAVGFARRYG